MKEALRNLLLKMVGCPYIWGGANPWTGLDCSGFAIWCLQVFGVLSSGDWTAAELAAHLQHVGECRIDEADVGDLVFYAPDGIHISHVMVALGRGLCVGASGGGPDTETFDDARKLGAAVKVKPIRYRSDLVKILRVSLILEAIEAEAWEKRAPLDATAQAHGAPAPVGNAPRVGV